MCPGTTLKGKRCKRRGGWCKDHEDQKDLHEEERCEAVRDDGERCTQKAVNDIFCKAPAHWHQPQCAGITTGNVQCSLSAIDSGYCGKYQYQAKGQVCRGAKRNGERCWGKAKSGEYCRPEHDPGFVCFVWPEELRVEIDMKTKKKIEKLSGGLDAYTQRPIGQFKQLDHVVEHQLGAYCMDLAWKSQRDHFGSSEPLEEVVKIVRDSVANANFNLKFTSKYINMLKGKACSSLIKARREEDVVTTFTEHMRQVKFQGKELSRETTCDIRDTMLKTMKRYQNKIDDENDNNSTMTALDEELQELRVAIKTR